MRTRIDLTMSWRGGRALSMAMAIAFAGALARDAARPRRGLAEAKAEVEAAMQKPQFVPPGEAFDISKLKGKHVWIITSTMAVPFVATIAHGVEAAAKVAGIETTLFDGKGDVSQWNRGMAQAVAQHADGIVTVGASPELMKGPMADALKANIPVVDAVTADKTASLVPGHVFARQHLVLSFGATSGRLRHREVRRQGACPDPRRQRVSWRSLARRRHAEGIVDTLSRIARSLSRTRRSETSA